MLFDYFLINNKSGYKTKESWFSKNHVDDYQLILDYNSKIGLADVSFKEKIWIYFNKLDKRPICITCGKELIFSDRFDRGYGEFCSVDCINNNRVEMLSRITKANLKTHGVEYYPQHKDFSTKVRSTKKIRFNDENYNNIEKCFETKIERYNDKHYNNSNKAKETSIAIYGVDNPSKHPDVIKKIELTNFKIYGTKAPTQSKGVLDKLKNTLLLKIKNRFKTDEFIDYDFINHEITLKCLDCNSIYTIQNALLNERKRNNQITCITCNPIGVGIVSTYENELFDELKLFYNDEILRSNRTTIKGELDIYIPDKKIAIEIDGLYWHSELFKNTNYHLNKTIECDKLGISLIHIFEDEWIYKKDVCLSIIKNKLGITNNKIFARKCSIRLVNNSEANLFLDKNHIQGSGSKNSYRVGLYYQNELVSLMTLSKGRLALGGNSNEWELTRFCSKLNTNIVGGANKLFKYFMNDIKPIKIVTFSDKRWFNGNIYENLGFTKIYETKPNYWYVVKNIRNHRFNYRKSELIRKGFDSNKSETEIMLERKIYRIYDCGNIKFEIK